MRDSLDWFPDNAYDLFFMAASASGEAGELVNEAKKLKRGTDSYGKQRDKIAEESIDVLIYLANVWAILGVDPIGRYNVKREHNRRRFGQSRPAGESGS